MEEKVDCFSFHNRFLDGERDRIDSVERLISARAQQHFQPRDDARIPRPAASSATNRSSSFFSSIMACTAIRNVET
jgi:hypothetical protein